MRELIKVCPKKTVFLSLLVLLRLEGVCLIGKVVERVS